MECDVCVWDGGGMSGMQCDVCVGWWCGSAVGWVELATSLSKREPTKGVVGTKTSEALGFSPLIHQHLGMQSDSKDTERWASAR